jgi:polyhydroxyalkanoate synthase subunit PhaC
MAWWNADMFEWSEGISPAVLDRMGVAETPLGRIDVMSLMTSLGSSLLSSGRHPVHSARAWGRFGVGMAEATVSSAVRVVGRDFRPAVEVGPKDKRFSDPAWQENAGFFWLLQAYLLSRGLLTELSEVGSAGADHHDKAAFAASLLADLVAPTNFLPTNPSALTRAFQTGGLSVVRGMVNMRDDLVKRRGWPRQVDSSKFAVGENMAATPGKVVYRNDLIELIQFSPATDQTREIPLLVGPPWINKYYILDLAPGKSFVEWAVSHGLTTFAISYRNPDSSMRDFGFDDYLLKGPRTALDVIREITGAETVNTASACIGGTLNTALLAYLDATGDNGLVNSATTMNCLVDHSGAGTLSKIFTDEATIERLERQMSKKGYLEAADMAHSFDILRANDLVFAYLVSGWLKGEDPPAFDLLAWNNDSTRMPAKMHSFYLRECWMANSLANDRMVLAGERLVVSRIDVDSYIVAAIDDHIVPWRSSYKTTQVLKGDCRFALSSAGHIAGIVNPPSPKAKLWTNDDLPTDPDEWLSGAAESADTWWTDWIQWVTSRSGDLRAPPPMGSAAHPVIDDAPGRYVRG